MPARDVRLEEMYICLEETYAYKRYVPARNACLYARERCVYLEDISIIGVILVGILLS